MPTAHTDQFFVIDPGSAPAAGTALTVQTFNYVDQDDDGFIGTTAGDTFNGGAVTSVWVGDTITVTFPPSTTQVTVTGVTFYVSGQPAVFTPTDGTILQDAVFVSSTFVNTSTQIAVSTLLPTCFARGTMIATPEGPRAIETLTVGDLILTRDHGPQPLLHVSRDVFTGRGRNAPVRICKGALGNEADLWVSQQHRMLITDWRAELYFGEDEVLVAARHLVNGDTIYIHDCEQIEYFHLLFASHEVIWSAGIPSESYLPAHFAEREGKETQDEIRRLFPDLPGAAEMVQQSARPVVRGVYRRLLAS